MLEFAEAGVIESGNAIKRQLLLFQFTIYHLRAILRRIQINVRGATDAVR